ncbi:MAG: alpha/beta hydrolase [Burkholderiales bacterium]|jgi:alpha/beta superfamily hydrolase|nr:alpha/beta hydrolase [Burkholderiales bacterium]
MHASTLERARIAGPAGAIETDINDPGDQRRGIALVAHPHPLQGGTKDNKVVTTLAKAFFSLDHVVMRPNFRGAGASEGMHDEGRGETEDLLVVVQYAKQRYGELPLVLAGFSFGSFIQSQVARRVAAARLILVAPAVNRFATETVPESTLVIHGERDDVVPLGAVLDWARPQNLPVVVVPGGEHFFHGRLSLLSRIVLAYCH